MRNSKIEAVRGDMPNGFNPAHTDHLAPSAREHIQRRVNLLGPGYRLFYNEPVGVVRAKGAYLYDKDGKEYLDAYNNVVSVGHCHPHVVAAITEQMNTLCSHTRYMQDGILDYAEQLRATTDGDMADDGQMMFTCSGSEANDLAIRIARHHTGNTGVIVTSEAYHGNSATVAAFSPSLGANAKLDPYVRQVPSPDSYRIPREGLGRYMADQVAAQIRDIQRHGGGVAAFIADCLFSSDGLFCDPVDVFGPIAEVVRKAGGLFIADEVQSGFGRSGTHFWGHQRHGVAPDIITMGKPMGNGYPVAGLMVRPDVVASFGRDMRYFNTFGGNSVAIAAAQATLDVIQREDLMANARHVGGLIMAGLTDLVSRYERIGDVRGTGMYFAVELVTNRDTKTPDMKSALKVVNHLRDNHVLISATGPDASILKIRPPLIWTLREAGRLLDALESAFADL
jgi:4-aminobutyrate aminotransferase-like enzyme